MLPVILLNIKEVVQILEGLTLYSLNDGNVGSIKAPDYTSVLKFQVYATNIKTGERLKCKYALQGRLVARKGVSVDHEFVFNRIVETVKQHLAGQGLIISGELPPGVTLSRAVWRYIFTAGTRVADFANGIGIFSQPQETNFVIGVDPLERLQVAKDTFTLAVSNGKIVKFYLGEEFPQWGVVGKDEDDKVWSPCRKKITPAIVDSCIEHFTAHISQDNEILEAFAGDDMEALLDFVQLRLDGPTEVTVVEPAVEEKAEPKEPAPLTAPVIEAVTSGAVGLFKGLKKFIGQ